MDCTVLITHYQTPDLLRDAVASLRQHYSNVDVVVVDNGSSAASLPLLESLGKPGREDATWNGAPVRVHRLESNRYHGPAMDFATRELISSRYVFTLDSDTLTKAGGFLEQMISVLDVEDKRYACGRVLEVNRRGFATAGGEHRLCWVPYMMFRRDTYLSLSPFEHHGVPNLTNSIAASNLGFEFVEFPISDYIHHIGRGTAARFGYGLGIRGRVTRTLRRLGL